MTTNSQSQSQQYQSQSRRNRAHLSQFNTTQIHLRNPFVVTFWSLMSPGLGYFMQDRTLKAFVTVIWGIFINVKAQINLAIVYSFTGRFDLAKSVVDKRWFILYLAVYVYGIWDGYRGTVDLNKQYRLADLEDAKLQTFNIASWDINFMDKRSPWVAVMWSAFMPGLGYLYLHKVVSGLFMIGWSIIVLYMSHALEAIHLTLICRFPEAKAALDTEWLLYLPATYAFAMMDCYIDAVENNKLFEKEQSQFLREEYPIAGFKMPRLSQE
ncbi:hypothetical protein [Paenibacillus montanisoli]|uniref:Uncharacterized protein n=1 Tax=Paenibacillus montanisoli TaxID=2081970 RepID=A0A328U6H4_9BACL|nr:hypothetical protein [Paenibacillus montanisoli]RAP78179.1 hypothetical protein DL346_07035 [Paenibacillus montanisoli]